MKKLLLLLSFTICLLTAASLPHAALAQDSPHRIEITAKRFVFDPGEITLKKGQPVVLVITSADVNHGFRIREFGVNVTIPGGRTVEVAFTPNKTGDFIAHCSVFCGPGHGSMELKLHVVV
jgi:cytochrome c oxidase subunit II